MGNYNFVSDAYYNALLDDVKIKTNLLNSALSKDSDINRILTLTHDTDDAINKAVYYRDYIMEQNPEDTLTFSWTQIKILDDALCLAGKVYKK